MNNTSLNQENGILQFHYADPVDHAADVIQAGRNANPGHLPPAVVAQMTALSAFLQADVGAAWALAGELAGGSPALQAMLFGGSTMGLAAMGVGAVAYGATTSLDKYFDGAIHTAFLDAVMTVGNLEHRVADRYFGGEGFSTDNVPMMSAICSNWTDYWDNIPQLVAPIQHQLG